MNFQDLGLDLRKSSSTLAKDTPEVTIQWNVRNEQMSKELGKYNHRKEQRHQSQT